MGENRLEKEQEERPIIRYTIISTRIGRVFVAATDKGICRIHFPSSKKLLESVERSYSCELVEDSERFKDIVKQLRSYFSGNLNEFDCELDFVKGTDFQKKVWKTLLKIPYGEVRSYKWVAEQVGCPNGFRAVGGANHNNPIPIIVPCHRVIGSDGSMVGYGGPSKDGQEMKRSLLRMEGAID
jgi:methylated-DNA-[protein]-cysteine S-methyltransferase